MSRFWEDLALTYPLFYTCRCSDGFACRECREKLFGPFRAVSYPQPFREDLPDWVKRSKRLHLNMVEILPVFAAIVLVVHSLGSANLTTALGAQSFFWARFAMAVGPMGEIHGLRSVFWFVSLAGLVIILLQIF